MAHSEMVDRIVVITGAAGGIGRATAELFADKGARLALLDRNPAVVEVAKELGAAHAGFVVDITDAEAIEHSFAQIAKAFGRIDILVNNAGVAVLAPAEELTADQWDTTMTVNLRAPFLCARAAGRYMLAQKYGRIVNIASQAAVIGIEDHVAYCASKAGIIGMTNCLALEWGPKGITTNSISPTVVETEMAKVAWAGEKGDRARAEIPTRRFAQPREVAETVYFLASDAAAMINGANLMLDGGNTIR